MSHTHENEAVQGRRAALKTLLMGAGSLTALPMLGQTETARAASGSESVPATKGKAIRLIVRGDDFGMTEGNLEAIEQAMNQGVMTCTSMIVAAPWFKGAAALARRNPSWCTGIHLCLTGEWRGYRWRPVLPWDKIPSVVDDEGFFYGDPQDMFSRKPSLKEIDMELRAQIDLAKKNGVHVQYLDTHYFSPTVYPGLKDTITAIARHYDLPISGAVGEKFLRNVYHDPPATKEEKALAILNTVEPGLWVLVCHVGIDSPEQRALIHTYPSDIFLNGGVGVNRAAELKVLLSYDVKAMILRKGIQLTTYREIWRERSQG